MNLFEYLDRRHRRMIILRELKYWRKEYDLTAKIFDRVPERLMNAYIDFGVNEKKKIEYYTGMLNSLL